MIIKLKGADFSADNIGKVQVTTALHPFTLAAIEASGNTSMTMEQKSALNDLFLAMGVDGSNDVMSKMRRVYLPIIAGSVAKALVNYQSSDFSVDKELTDEYWTLRNHGLVGLKQGQAAIFTETPPIMADNFTSMFLRTERMTRGVFDTTRALVLRGKANTNLFLGLQCNSSSGDNAFNLGTYGASWGGFTNKADDRLKTWAITSKADSSTRIFDGVLQSDTTPYAITSDMSGETSQTLYAFGLSNENIGQAYAVGILGEAITAEQTINIASKIDALYNTFVGVGE